MIIGLTGTIGSGKSTVSARLAKLGALVLDADTISREAVKKGADGLNKIAEVFGKEVIDANGELDRKALAGIVFSDESKRLILNGIIHPQVLKALKERTHGEKALNPDRMIVWDVPLLIEVGWVEYVDSVWLVTAPEQTRINRIMARDGCTIKQAQSRICAQMSEEEKARFSNEIIDNGGSLEQLYQRVDALYSEYSNMQSL
ncbi:MAG: dephospho-CoA kinase [Clostridiales bacterium]|nr:dephospho-CoA kinase [Clostridiales bacterium]